MSSSQFSTLQKLALAAIVMGGIMCLVGLIVPYWAVFGIDGAEGDLGLWMLCGHIWELSSCGIIPFFLTGNLFIVKRVLDAHACLWDLVIEFWCLSG